MTVKEVAAFLRAHDSYLILTHRRPDGDTLGCAAALCAMLRQMGKTAALLPNAEVHEPLCRLRRALLGGGGLPL